MSGRKSRPKVGAAKEDSLQDMGRRFVGAWHRAEQGEPVNETHVTFLDLEAMLATLSPRRLELLKYVRQHGATNTRELAAAIGRDYKNVHQDVAALETAGLLLRAQAVGALG